MSLIFRAILLVITLSLLSVNPTFSQLYNKEIEAKIEIEDNHEFINISATAYNKTLVNQSLRYVFSIIRTDSEGEQPSKKDITNYFSLMPSQKLGLHELVVN